MRELQAKERWEAERRFCVLFGRQTLEAIRRDVVERYCGVYVRSVQADRAFRAEGDRGWIAPRCVTDPTRVEVEGIRPLDPDSDRHAVGCTCELWLAYGDGNPAGCIVGVRPDGTFTTFAD